MALKLIIAAFPENATIPDKYGCTGENISPAVEWSGAPAKTRSFALIVDDPDAPGGTFTHWLLWSIPDTIHSLDENFKPTLNVQTGTNDFGKKGYGGPCPPSGTHRYVFKLFALDTPTLQVKDGAKRAELERALHGHIVEKAEYMGKYSAK